MRYAFLLTILCAAGAFAQAVLPGEEKMQLVCRQYSFETFCFPKGWKTKDPLKFKTGDRLGYRHVFYLSRGKSDSLAEVQVSRMDTLKNREPIDPENPISELGYDKDCSSGERPCYTYLGKKTLKHYTAQYYHFYPYDARLGKELYVYLFGRKGDIYLLEYRAHKDYFKKYEQYFYAILGSLRPNKPAK